MLSLKKHYSDIACGVFLILMSILIYIDSYNIRVIAKTTLDAAFFPRMLAIIILLLSTVIILKACHRTAVQKKEQAPETASDSERKADVSTLLPAIGTLVLFGAYVFSLERLGFLISTAIYVGLQACIMSPKEKRKPVVFVVLGVVSSLAIYLLFKFGFQLMMPPGILG